MGGWVDEKRPTLPTFRRIPLSPSRASRSSSFSLSSSSSSSSSSASLLLLEEERKAGLRYACRVGRWVGGNEVGGLVGG